MSYISQLKYLLITILVILLFIITIFIYRVYNVSDIIDCITHHIKKPFQCIFLNTNYRYNLHYYHWTNDDRNVAINLIHLYYPEISVNDLQKLNNESLYIIQNNICIPIKKPTILCHLNNPNYTKNKPYQLWTLGDRNAIIQLINFYYPNLSILYLQKLKNMLLDKIIISICK